MSLTLWQYRIKQPLRVAFTMLALLMVPLATARAQDLEKAALAAEYSRQGETEKAVVLFAELAKDVRTIPFIHRDYFAVLVETGAFNDAQKYIRQAIRAYPTNLYYQIDQGILFKTEGQDNKAEKVFRGIAERVAPSSNKVRQVAQYFINNSLNEWALETYKEARKARGENSSYALELATVYRFMGKKPEMIDEYVKVVQDYPQNLRYVKNQLQNLVRNPEELEELYELVYDKLQRKPQNVPLAELLTWINLQQKNFYGAFIQARALDLRSPQMQPRTIEIGQMAMNNQDYETAIEIYEYVVKKYKGSNWEIISRGYLIKSREELVKNTYPVNKENIKKLIAAYDDLLEYAGYSRTTLEGLRSKALLQAFYLDERQQAVKQLEALIVFPRIPADLRATCKLDLGDIYMLMDQPWESALLYAQVEKAFKDSPISYDAKLRNARLSYYKGDFELAQGHLDILKLATSREISNDAMSLSILIQNNTVLDTAQRAMRQFAEVDLKLFQNKKDSALLLLGQMQNDFKDHPLQDEVLLKMAQLKMQMGAFEQSLALLEAIEESYADEILADDAMFMRGRLYQEQIKNNDKAMEVYQQFLIKHPGSIFAAEARKRFRKLRGDFIENVN